MNSNTGAHMLLLVGIVRSATAGFRSSSVPPWNRVYKHSARSLSSSALLHQDQASAFAGTADLCDKSELAEHADAQLQVVNAPFRHFGAGLKFHGQVRTVKCHEDNTLVKKLLSTEQGRGQVLIVDGGGSNRCALVGDLIAAAAVKNGWAGIVVYGCVRDTPVLKDLAIGIMALDSCPRRSKRTDATQGLHDVDIRIANTLIQPGHYCYADTDGLVVAARALH